MLFSFLVLITQIDCVRGCIVNMCVCGLASEWMSVLVTYIQDKVIA